MLKLITLFAVAVFITVANAACPRTLASGTYSGIQSDTNYVLANGTLQPLSTNSGLMSATFDGKGTATIPGVLTITSYDKSAAQASGTTQTTVMRYFFDPVKCMGTVDRNSNVYSTAKFNETDSGLQINFIIYIQGINDTSYGISQGVVRKQ